MLPSIAHSERALARSLASHSLPSRELTPDTDGGLKLQSYQRLRGRRVAGFIRKAGNQGESRRGSGTAPLLIF